MDLNSYFTSYKSFYFYVIDFENDFSHLNDVVNVYNDCLTNPYGYLKDGYYIILYQHANLEDEAVLQAINDDFSQNIKVFKSCKIYHLEDYQYLVSLVIKSLSTKKKLLLTISNLVTDYFEEKNHQILAHLKSIVCKKILEDNKLQEIIQAMFINNLNICKTASYVYMHRNTINNKIDFIAKETTLDIQKFYDAVVIYTLLRR